MPFEFVYFQWVTGEEDSEVGPLRTPHFVNICFLDFGIKFRAKNLISSSIDKGWLVMKEVNIMLKNLK